ncbi:MAG: SDR family oxidoreductase, partial [Planctomycetota bacterium]|nr:SDR family oxidoreductase [Planctomycetota bacterium]
LVVFDNVEVASPASTRSLLGAFSFVDRQHGMENYTCSIFDILNEAKFETAWLTNSVIENIIAFAGGDAFVRMINANVQRYEDINVPDKNGKYLDEATLLLLEDILVSSQSSKGIFVRFNGSHMHYVNRYPLEFARFKDYPDDPNRPWLTPEKKSIINQYDNSILYTDHVVAEFIETMKKQGRGSIINTASMSAHIVNVPQRQCSYNTSKAAVMHLTKSLAVEWARYGIRVNSISPGYMNGPMAGKFFDDPEIGPVWRGMTPMRRPGEPEELVGAAVLLASDASSFTTGSDYVMDGGFTCV